MTTGQKLRLFCALLLLQQSAFAAFWNKKSKKQERHYHRVERGPIVQRVTVSGFVEPLRKNVVTAPYTGFVKKLYVKLGQKVKKGMPLVTIAQSLESGEDNFPLRAPFDGTVVQIHKREGEPVQQNSFKDFILRIDQRDKLFVFSKIPELDISKVKLGQKTKIRAQALLNQNFQGKITEISLAGPIEEDWRGMSQVEFDVLIEILNPNEALKSGMSTIVDIIVAEESDVVAIPHEYIFKDHDQNYVFNKKGDKVSVKLGIQNEMMAEIKEGVNVGDTLSQIDYIKLLNQRKRH